jgi:hypothetical protein
MQKELRNILIAKLVDRLIKKKNDIKNLVNNVPKSKSQMKLYFWDSQMNYVNFDRGEDRHGFLGADKYYYTQAIGNFKFDISYRLEKSEIDFLSNKDEIKNK